MPKSKSVRLVVLITKEMESTLKTIAEREGEKLSIIVRKMLTDGIKNY